MEDVSAVFDDVVDAAGDGAGDDDFCKLDNCCFNCIMVYSCCCLDAISFANSSFALVNSSNAFSLADY